jgi:uncharacterized membrane protein
LIFKYKHSIQITTALAAALVFWLFYPVDGPRYDITEIHQPSITYQTIGTDINDQGAVIGQFYGPNSIPDHAYQEGLFVFSKGLFSEIKMPSSVEKIQYLYAKAINNRGDIVGGFQTRPQQGPSKLVSFLHRDGQTRTDMPWSSNYLAIDINDEGSVIAGGTEKMPCEVFDFASSAPPPAPIATKMGECEQPSTYIERNRVAEKLVGPNYKLATAINNSGQVSFIKPMPGFFKEYAINEKGDIVGQRQSEDKFKAFVVKDGKVLDLPTGSDESEAISINNVGDIIGKRHNRYLLPFMPFPAYGGGYFLYKDGKMHDLNRIAGFRFSSPEKFSPIKINNRGQILANIQVGGKPRAVVLTPK